MKPGPLSSEALVYFKIALGYYEQLMAAQVRSVVWLRNVGSDEDECWVVCAKGDPGAVAFCPISEVTRPPSNSEAK